MRFGANFLVVNSRSTCYQNVPGTPFLVRFATCHFDYILIFTSLSVGTVILNPSENPKRIIKARMNKSQSLARTKADRFPQVDCDEKGDCLFNHLKITHVVKIRFKYLEQLI